MEKVEKVIQAAIDAKEIPGCALVAHSADGSFSYAKAFGVSSLPSETSPDPPALKLDGVYWMASCTKLLTAISTLQCVQRGLFGLDESKDVEKWLPELGKLPLLKGFEVVDGKEQPILGKAEKKITLRQLLTHNSGLAYDFMAPQVAKWRILQGGTPGLKGGDFMTRISTPLVFEPGTGWQYSTGHDWAGIMIERATKTPIDQYILKHIWTPLSIADLSFHPPTRPDLQARRVKMTARVTPLTPFGTPQDPNGPLIAGDLDALWNESGTPDSVGGAGAFTTAPDYAAVMHSLTANDGKLLSSAFVDELFSSSLSPSSQQSLMKQLAIPEMNYIATGGISIGTEFGYAPGGGIALQDVEDGKRRRKGAIHWGGLPNLFWWMDREAGVSGILAAQVIPTGDPKVGGLFAVFERGVYEAMAGKK